MTEETKSSTFYGRDDIPEKLHPVCQKCIARARSKYTEFTSDIGRYHKDGFAVECPYIPYDENFLSGNARSVLTPDIYENVNSAQVPLLWAEKNLIDPELNKPWRAWPYQKGPLLCKSPRIALRFGRRCLPKGTPVLMANGEERPIEEIRPGDEVVSYDVESRKETTSPILYFWDNGRKPIYRISLLNGKRLDCTENHPLLTDQFEWVSIEDGLSVGQEVAARDSSGAMEFSTIASIEFVGELDTFDVEVARTYCLVSSGIYSHNTGKSTILAVIILWYLFTSAGGFRSSDTKEIRKNLKIVLLAPQKAHVENIFDRIRAFLNVSPGLLGCVDRNKRGSPQLISLFGKDGKPGGNEVKGFASGESSGSKGISVRGVDADLVITDEGAWISKDVMEGVIHPILYTKSTTRLIVSSTPSGIAGDYYETVCTQRPDFAEFYVPATDRPDWEKQEEQVKRDFGSNQEEWDKEVLALFSPAGIGVYKDDLVKIAQEDYSYSRMTPNGAFIYTFGVDWNKEHGTEVVVLATQKGSAISRIVNAVNIPKKEFTTPAGISTIVELNRLWSPTWIYVDDGGGDGAMMLQHHGRAMAGKNQRDAALMNIVKAYNFSSKVEVRDHSGKLVAIPSKQFMVENSVKRFELQAVKYPREDLNITRQLNNYIVVRRTLAGTPVYGLKEPKWGDHRLDALNLALVAIRLEMPSLFSEEITPMGIPIAHIPNPDSPSIDRVLLPIAIPTASRGDNRGLYGNTSNIVMWGNQPGRRISGPFGGKARKFGR